MLFLRSQNILIEKAICIYNFLLKTNTTIDSK